MNYDELSAGQDTDRLIAERVFGYRILWVHRAWSLEDWHKFYGEGKPTQENALAIVRERDEDYGPPYLVMPSYSADIAAAFQVAEAMNTRFGMQLSLDMWGGDPWWAEFADRQYIYGAQSTAPTAPLAICRAALKTLAYKEKLDQKEVE